MTVTTAREVSDHQRVGLDDATAAMGQAATAGHLKAGPGIVAAVGPGSS